MIRLGLIGCGGMGDVHCSWPCGPSHGRFPEQGNPRSDVGPAEPISERALASHCSHLTSSPINPAFPV